MASPSSIPASSSLPLRKRYWTPKEDNRLNYCVNIRGAKNWDEFAKNSGLQRDGHSCRLRWMKYLKLGINIENFTEEDDRLIYCVNIWGAKTWDELAKNSGLQRSGNSCRFRWMNYLKPGINIENFTEAEDREILRLHIQGYTWVEIARELRGRTDNQVKNRYNSHLAKKPEEQFKELCDYSIPEDQEFQNFLHDILHGKDGGDDNNMPITDFELGIFNLSST